MAGEAGAFMRGENGENGGKCNTIARACLAKAIRDLLRRRVAGREDFAAADSVEGKGGGGGFGAADAGAFAFGPENAAVGHGDAVVAAVGRTVGGEEGVFGVVLPVALGPLLEFALGIDFGGGIDGFAEEVVEGGAEEAAYGFGAAVEPEGADDGFEGVGERGIGVAAAGEVFAAPEPEAGTETDEAGDAGEGGFVGEAGADLGQASFVPAGLGEEEVFGDGQAEGGIAEELKPLVVVGGVGGMLGGVGGMGQGGAKEGRVGEGVAETSFERAERGAAAVWRQRIQGFFSARRRSTVKARSLPRRSRATTAPLRSRR